jgi:FlaA1/EpsC-like NDP-sugar epimerase
MSRFLLSLDQAIDLVFQATVEMEGGEIFVKKMPAVNMKELAEVISFELTGRKDYPIENVEIRPGEKIHEILVSEEDMRHSEEREDCFIIHPLIKFKGKFIEDKFEYGSKDERKLTKDEIKKLLELNKLI